MIEYGAVGCGFSSQDQDLSQLYEYYRQPGRGYFVACRGEELLGGAGLAPLAGAGPECCELRKMYLLPEARGLGLGYRLLRRCLSAQDTRAIAAWRARSTSAP